MKATHRGDGLRPGSGTEMEFLDVMNAYFRDEKLEAAFFILPVGLLFLAMAYGAWRSETGGFMWGVLVPSLLFGLVFVGIGVGVAARTDGQVRALEAAYESEPQAIVRDELPRMQKVEALFHTTLPAFGGLALLGLCLRFGLKADWALGLGAVLIAAGGCGLLIDGFASRRAAPYVAALEAVAATQGDVPSDQATGPQNP